MYLVQERPVDNPTRREITKTTSLGKAFISEMKCIRNIRISAMKCSFHCNEMFSSLKWNALLSEMTSPRNARISEMKWKEPAGGWKTQKSEKNYTVILFTVCHSVGHGLAWLALSGCSRNGFDVVFVFVFLSLSCCYTVCHSVVFFVVPFSLGCFQLTRVDLGWIN